MQGGLAVAGLLTWVAGFVDAVGFLSLGRIYTANMSGNSVAIGIHLSSQSWSEMLRRVWPVAAYVIGLVFARFVIEAGARERIRSAASVVFACEIAFLAPACILGLPSRASLDLPVAFVGLLALAMGSQNGALTRFSSLTLHTGFVTGTLVKFAQYLTRFLTFTLDRMRNGETLPKLLAESRREESLRLASFLLAIYLAYIAGAVCGALGERAMNLRALIVPVGCLALLIFIDLQCPLALQDEEKQNG
jgi:uncharacterized membrane protein YoaK (UPF0700 family)